MPGKLQPKCPAPPPAPSALHSQESALLRAIAADPEDDVVRLVYADWLEESGRADHAAFVRAQCQLGQVEAVESQYEERSEALRTRGEALTPRREGAWAMPSGAAITFHRGLPAFVSCEAREFAERGPEWLEACPTLYGLKLTDLRHRNAAPAARALASSGYLGRLTRLWVSDSLYAEASAPAVRALLASPHLGGLTHLDLAGCSCRGASVLSQAGHLTRLSRLELANMGFGDERLASLLDSPIVGGLTYLGLQHANLREAGLRALAGCERLQALTTLALNGHTLPAGGVKTLASSPHLGRLRHINLSSASLRTQGARALARATWLPGLTWLDLANNSLKDAGVKELVGADRLANLEHLDLSHNQLTDRGVEALASSASLANLRFLRLRDVVIQNAVTIGIGDASVLALARSPHLANLRELHLQANVTAAGLTVGTSRLGRLETLAIDWQGREAVLALCGLLGTPANLVLRHARLSDEGVVALAAMPGMRQVVRLNLAGNGVGDRGAKALAESPHLANLEELHLPQNRVGAAGVEALLAGLPRLTRLDLSDNPLKNDGLRRLAASPGVSRLTWLRVGNVKADEEGLGALGRSPHLANLRCLYAGYGVSSGEAALRLIGSPNLPRLGKLVLYVGHEAADAVRQEAARRGVEFVG